MKRKLFKSIGLAVLLLTLLVSNVFAFSLGTTDGVWGRIDNDSSWIYQGATCERYAAVSSPSYKLLDGMGVAYNVNVGPGGETERYIRNADVCSGNTIDDYTFATSDNPAGWQRDAPDGQRFIDFRTYHSSCGKIESPIISRYVYYSRDGADHLAIEIYNKTGDPINLSTYSLLLFTGDQEFTKVDLSGEIANEGYYVVGTADTRDKVSLNQEITDSDDYRTVALVKDYRYGNVDFYGNQDNRTFAYNISGTDENQVRYGTPLGYILCPNENGNEKDKFQIQSGFGFQGMVTDSSFEPDAEKPFPVGRFCHYNNAVTSINGFDSVELSLKIKEIACPEGQTIRPVTKENTLDMDFKFSAQLEETDNFVITCEYGPNSPAWPSYGGSASSSGGTGLNRNGCADMVKFTSADDVKFTCVFDDDHEQDYYLSLLGFAPTTVGADCPDSPVGTLQFNQVYTAEEANSCFCMYAAYTKNQITPVTMASIGANWTEKGVLIDWETVSETNNFGFNIMRAESVDGERIQINPEMIFSGLAPGDPFGSSYEYLDETAVPGTEYFYWLVDVPLDSSEPGIYGPISPAE